MMSLGMRCCYLSISLYLMYPGHTLLCTLYTHCYDALGIHSYDDHWYTLLVLIYIIIPHVPWVYIVMMTLGIHCYDDPWYTLLVLIYIIIPYVPWVYIAMMTLDTHCYDDLGYTLLL